MTKKSQINSQVKLKLSKSSINFREEIAVKRVLRKEYLGMGSEVKLFERELEKFIGGKGRVLCVSSGTAALHLALQSINLKPGDEVVVPSITYVASYQAISATGAKPVSCDVSGTDLMIDISDLKRRITKKTKAIMPVHYAGATPKVDEIYKIAKKNNLRVIEDAAHAFGCKSKKGRIGKFGDIVCFSFDGIKNITSGEGGAVVVFDKKNYDKISDLRLLAVKKDSNNRYREKRTWDFDVTEQGWRYHMSDIMAAIGREQLKKFTKFSLKRQKVAKYYHKKLSSCIHVNLLDINYDQITPHIFVIILNNKLRDKVRSRLADLGIETGIHWKPCHHLSKYKTNYKLVNIEKIYKNILTLPCHFDVSKKHQDIIVREIFRVNN